LTAISPKAAILPVPSIISPDLRTKSASMGSAARSRRVIKGRIMGKSLKIRDKGKGIEGVYRSKQDVQTIKHEDYSGYSA
jgi:hypothetical protein